MEGIGLAVPLDVEAKPLEAAQMEKPRRVERSGASKQNGSLAEEMKDVRKQKLHRMVYQDPALAKKLVAAEASPVYNARGELIQSLGTVSVGVG